MPRKRRRRRRPGQLATAKAILLGEPRLAPDPLGVFCGFVKLADDELAAAWAEHGEAWLPEYVEARPGNRPPGWWRYEAAEPRRIEDEGNMDPRNVAEWREHLGRASAFGKATPDRAWRDDRPDFPIYETQIDYLIRLDLLMVGEEERFDALPEDRQDDILAHGMSLLKPARTRAAE